MKTDTPETDAWEAYCDECYYHMWRLRRKTERGWYDGFHIHTGEEAKGLCETLNKLERERDEARNAAENSKAYKRVLKVTNAVLKRELNEAREYADKLAEGLPDGMLPKDVEVLREANLGLATELATVTAQRDEAREALKTGGMLNIIDRAAHERAAAIRERDEARKETFRTREFMDYGFAKAQEELTDMTAQRDRLAEALQDLVASCNCIDSVDFMPVSMPEAFEKAQQALQSLTQKEEL